MGQKVMRLPPLKKFRIKKPDEPEVNPCLAVMASLLGCWASQGFAPEGCGRIEEQLRSCMDAKKQAPPPRNNINYHLGRLYPLMRPQHKKQKGYQ
ncbi:37S ribosomal protein Mrp10 [Tuber magnatum]|uniref:37S ribosomal protein Mrp10 n=2 Tax=Tuber TaxID=36048 RepID=A0A317SLX0_9PEZI|nr:37S ribosomal protein Mrp10 [Tuber magnatum]